MVEAYALVAAPSDTTDRSNTRLRRVVSMSDIQQYLLDYDRNKKEASATAQRSANRMCGDLEGHDGTKADSEQNYKAVN